MRHRVADLDGPVHYIDFGGTGAPLLMVHGLGGSAINWMAVGPELARDHRPLALDLAGFGETPLQGRSAAVGANANLVHDFIRHVIGEPVMLIGNSMGGHIAILESADHPQWVTACVLVDAAVSGEDVRRSDPVRFGALAALSIPGLGTTFLDRRLRGVDAETLTKRAFEIVCADPSRLAPDVVAAHVKLTRERELLGRQNARAFVQALRSIGLRMADPRFWSRVAKIAVPTLIVHGSLDRVIPLSAARELYRHRPDWEMRVIDGAGHVPMLETPAQFMDALRSTQPFGHSLRTAS